MLRGGRCSTILVGGILSSLVLGGCTLEWHRYRDEDGGCEGWLPGEPRLGTTQYQIAGRGIALRSARVVLNERLRFMKRGFYEIMAGRVPPTMDPQAVLRTACQDLGKSFGGDVISDTDAAMAPHRARACVLHVKGAIGQVTARAVASEDRLCFAVVGGHDEAKSDDAKHFFETFSVRQ